MDREGVLRMAAALQAAANSGKDIGVAQYKSLRERVVALVGEDEDLLAVMPEQIVAAQLMPRVFVAVGSGRILGMTAAYLRELAARNPSWARVLAATDLMEQSERLLADRDIHVAAPIVLAAAALEEVLRDLVEIRELPVSGQPSLTKYAEALRSAGAISPGDVKEITALADIRNDAAHGRFGNLTHEGAESFVTRVNLMLRSAAVTGTSS